MPLYLDATAFIKLVVDEPESDALEAYVRGTDLFTSVITPTEVERALRRRSLESRVSLVGLFEGVDLRALDEVLVQRAGALEPRSLGVTDAIHLASAIDLRTELDGFVTYDVRLAEAARAQRLPVVAPA